LALIHSPLYQRTREDCIYRRLDVSLGRFGFDTQLFAASILLDPSGRSGAARRFSTTAEFSSAHRATGWGTVRVVIGLANSIQFAGDTQWQYVDQFSFATLRGAGRDVVLESLTQAERNAGERAQMEHFARGSFADYDRPQRRRGPQRGGNFLNEPSLGSGALRCTWPTARPASDSIQNQRLVAHVLIIYRIPQAERLDSLQLSQTEDPCTNPRAGCA
jgi:hypothetical protein